MTYLLDALQGEARQCVIQYQVSQSTYPIVIQHLKEKYDNKQALVRDLLRRLRTTEAKTERLEDQEKLCETLHSIVVQLQQKGELIDTLLLQQLLLEKFTKEIQRHARQKRRQRAEEARTCELLKDVKDYIRVELELRDREQGTVVLIHDPALPRNVWKMARIIDLKQTETGAIQETQLKLPSGRIIRRPINLLIPLELEDNPAEKRSDTNGETESPTNKLHSAVGIQSQRYNFRPQSRDNNVFTICQRCCSPQVEEDQDPKKHSKENGKEERESLCHHYNLQSQNLTQRTPSVTAQPTLIEIENLHEVDKLADLLFNLLSGVYDWKRRSNTIV
ncbi:unnamed protein product [Angiostrongylus costaricensis]|uniref:DUF5641 domain-containing protein n=1 Tax=Angiostrongylus costaricensis TaxID=334426 RepID=A0A158PF15_ANGCS|nr:unnamed protein product [Angiostrongylus costaricensis]